MKIAFILCYKYDHDNNDNAEDHCVSCSWAIISLVTLMSRLKLKKEDRIHKLGEYQPLRYQHTVNKGQLKEQNYLIRNACYSSQSSLTICLILKYQAHYEIFHLESFFINIGLITTVCQRMKFIQFQLLKLLTTFTFLTTFGSNFAPFWFHQRRKRSNA